MSILSVTSLAHAQTVRTVQGQVIDRSTNEPLPGVNVLIKGTVSGASTDAAGKYSLQVKEDNAVLVFSYVGYEKAEAVVGNQSILNMSLQPDLKSLEEVVVVGYGTQKKSDLTGAVATVSTKEITQLPVDRVEQGLQGRVAGVQVTQTSGAPGGTLRVRIRGSNSIQYGNDPLYVIDGFPVGGSSVFVNPNDVESMTVLKDASATAIYGARGANGVIIITTKKGSSGKTQVDYDAYYGVQQVTKKLDLLNAQDWATLDRQFWQVFRNGSLLSRAYTPEQISQMGKGTDWQDAIFRSAPIQSHNISIRGGNEKTKFSVSGNYFNQDGIVINSNFTKGNIGFNLEHKANDRFQFGSSLQLNYNRDRPIPHSTTGHDNSGVIYAALHSVPTLPVRNPDGSYSSQDKLWTQQGIYANPSIQNPVEMAERSEYKNTNSRILGNIYAQYKLAEGLVAKVSAGGYISNGRGRSYIPSDFIVSRTTGGTASINSTEIINWINENTLTYQKVFNTKHRIEALGGFSLQRERTESLVAGTQNFFTNVTGYNNLVLGQNPQFPESNVSQWSLASFLGRVNYDYDNKYLLTVSARYDGSSRFGKNNRFGFFPSAAVAWRVAEEDFLKDVSWLSDLKVRASIGVTGNQSIPLYQNLQTFGQGSPYAIGNTFVPTVVPGALVNENMKWESTRQIDAGIDIGLFNNRLTIVADYYNKTTRDLLFGVAIPRQGGYTSTLMNIGSVRNKGFEFGLNAVIVDKAVKWNFSGNIAFNRNKVLKLADADRFFGSSISGYMIQRNGGAGSVIMTGQPIGMFWGNIFDGLWQTQEEYNAGHMKTNRNTGPGFENYRDIDGNGIFEEGLDETIIGNPHPDYEFGINNTLTYKGFDLSVFMNGVQGNDILNLNLIDLTTQVNGMNGLAIYKNAWTGPGTSNTIAKVDRPDGRQGTFPNRASSNYIEDGSFVRLRNLTLGYTLPLKGMISKPRIYIAGENLLTFTNYSGYNPEVNSMGNNNTVMGVDMNAYPLARTYRLGLQVRF
ncbi:SusC/RagA family TonB-linked outer membrane protein [Larkinella bovis]|uniref:SusC/RagA family TonB-linked outer membrane protein n=1 Tax=Larkinella bovis TaxID=683041 RepID=A0ABW0ICA7_9BACT